jgi:DNA replication protein DnaC
VRSTTASRRTAPRIDDLGLRPLTHDEPLDLYEIIRQRYQRGATIITSNRNALAGQPPSARENWSASARENRPG